MYQRILVPIDDSPTSNRGLQEALALARTCGGKLVFLHVIDTYPLAMEAATPQTWELVVDGLRKRGQSLLDQAQAKAAAEGLDSEQRLVEFATTRVADSILEQARGSGCDLIVMGTHGRRGFSHVMLGSDAERVLRQSTLPVLLVRQS